jgi:hypothetical protein
MGSVSIGQKWPLGYGDNRWWIASTGARVQHGGGFTLTAECKSFDELVFAAEQLKADIDQAVTSARAEIEKEAKIVRRRF